ncbi:unnamed protein product [Ambrosiozyma monospora]|uniref:Unnamed protein product n=1 Tax=Ambrosiozyma monospora TaxID=43982 RepID=A0A9W7DIQ1_AMBMO|nr:unnamed protein product [Ambrosiozyma monospora]
MMIDWCRSKYNHAPNDRRLIISTFLKCSFPNDTTLSDCFARLIEVNELEAFEFEFDNLGFFGPDSQQFCHVSGLEGDNILEYWGSRNIKGNVALKAFAEGVLSTFVQLYYQFQLLISSLPKTVTSLNLFGVKISDSESCTISLPTHLKHLIITETIPTISNFEELRELRDVSVIIDLIVQLSVPTFSFDEVTNVLTRIKTLIHNLSPSMRSLCLNFRIGLENSKLDEFPADRLSLETLDSLDSFSFYCDRRVPFSSLSVLPQFLTSLVLPSFETLSGQFPSTLKSLDVNLNAYKASFSVFWKGLINPLKNLLYLKIIFTNGSKLDFTKLQFPPKILTIVLTKSRNICMLVFDQLPSSLIYFRIDCPKTGSFENRINVTNLKGMSMDELKILFILNPECQFRWLGSDREPKSKKIKLDGNQ